MKPITKETKIYFSLSEFPGNSGTLLFNKLFEQYGIDAIYKACKVDRGNLRSAIEGFRALGIAGGGVSMPFKEEAAELMDHLEGVAKRLGVINTIKTEPNGKLHGYNTDYLAALKVIPPDSKRVFVLGAGGVSRAVVLALMDRGVDEVRIFARKPQKVLLPEGVKYPVSDWANWTQFPPPKLLFNCTPLGMTSENELNIPAFWWDEIEMVVDLTFRPEGTQFYNQAKSRGIWALTGFDFSQFQAREQFKIYTGLNLENH